MGQGLFLRVFDYRRRNSREEAVCVWRTGRVTSPVYLPRYRWVAGYPKSSHDSPRKLLQSELPPVFSHLICFVVQSIFFAIVWRPYLFYSDSVCLFMYVHTNMYKQIHVCKDAFQYNVSICIFITIYTYIICRVRCVLCIYIYIYVFIIYKGFSNLSELYGQPSCGMESKLMFTSLSSGIIWIIWYGEKIHVDIHVMSWSVGGQWRRSMTWRKHVQSNARSEKHMKQHQVRALIVPRGRTTLIYVYIHIYTLWIHGCFLHLYTCVHL